MGAPPLTPAEIARAERAIHTTRPAVKFDTQNVPPSQYLYLQQNDQLQITTLTNTAPLNVLVQYRYLTPEGEIKEGSKTLTDPFAEVQFFNITIGEGWLLSIAFQSTTFYTAGQWVFAQVYVSRLGATSLNSAWGLIWQGYVPHLGFNGWPGTASKEITDGAGTLRSITGTQPAAGNEIAEAVPGSRRWKLLAWRASLTTSAAVANRNVTLVLDDGLNPFFHGISSTNQAAGITAFYSATPAIPSQSPVAGDYLIPAPLPIGLKANFRIRTSTTGLQAADQWSAPVYLVQEWGLWDV